MRGLFERQFICKIKGTLTLFWAANMQFIIGMYCADTSGAAFKICGKMKKN